MVDRILGLLKEKSMTPSQFADEIGVLRSSVSHIISGRNNPSLEFVMKILKRFPELDPNWLLFGTSKEYTEPLPETEIHKPVPPNLPVIETDKIPHYEKVISSKKTKQEKSMSEDKPAARLILIFKDNTFREIYPE